MIKAVIFDLDDTLISEHEYVKSGYQHISKILTKKIEKSEVELYKMLIELFNENSINVFNRIFDNLEIRYSKNEINELVEEYRNHVPDISFFDDVLPCLEILKENNIKIGVITDGYAVGQRQKLKALKASDLFDEIIVTDELGREYWKPHPKAFEMMKDKMNVEFNEIVYIGDNPKKDFQISSIYPLKTIRIRREKAIHKNKKNLNSYKLHAEINDLKKFKEKIDNI